MLTKNLHSVLGNERGKHAGCFWIEPLRALVSSLTFIALLPATLAAQSTMLALQATQQAAAVYSNEKIQAPLLFEGESLPGNQVSLSMGASTFYDDNIFLRNSLRFRDEALSIDSALDITRQTDRLTARFDYALFFPLYRQFDQFDKVDHAASLNLAYRLTSRVILGLYDTFSYQNGVYPVLTGEEMLSGPASPTALDQMIIPYTIRVLLNSAGLDLTFVKSRRTWLTFCGGYNEIKFGSQTTGEPLYNGNGFSGGLTFQHLVTEHTSFGVLLLHQDTSNQGGQVFGYRLRSQIESTILSIGSRLSPTVRVTVFGGPQYIRAIGEASGAPVVTGHFHPSGGGSITKEVRKTALDLSFRRIVYQGGGLYTSVISTNATFEVRRRLVGRWEAGFRGGAAQLDASLFKLANARTDGLFGGINISRPISRGSVFRIAYDSMHELSTGTLPIFANFDRNRVAVGIDYQFKALPLGR